MVRPKKKDSCVQVSEVKKIRVGRSKNNFILDFFFMTHVQRFWRSVSLIKLPAAYTNDISIRSFQVSIAKYS